MDFFRGELNTYGDLKVGGDFTLEASLSPLVSANDVEVRVITSHNLELTGLSDTRFLSRIGVDQNTTVLFPLRIIRAGEHEIGVSVTGAGELGGKEKNIYYLKVDSKEHSGCVKRETPTLPDGRNLSKSEQIPYLRTEARKVHRPWPLRPGVPSVLEGEVVISGYFGYIDPFEAGPEKPVRYATVEVYEIAQADTIRVGNLSHQRRRSLPRDRRV